jgi:hypothetical protein
VANTFVAGKEIHIKKKIPIEVYIIHLKLLSPGIEMATWQIIALTLIINVPYL